MIKHLFLTFLLIFTFTEAKTLKQLEIDNIKKPILVMVTMKGCRYCRKQKQLFAKETVRKFKHENFQYKEINMSYTKLPIKIYTRVAPTLFILSDKGDVLLRNEGYISSENKLMAFLKKGIQLNKVEKDLR